MSKSLLAALAFAALALPAAPTLAIEPGDAEEGRKIARMCSACHGRDGVAVRANTPNIAGQDPGYMAEQLAHFRSGDRVHPEMNVVAKGLSDEQIANLAAWYGGQPIPSN
jgi:cytochrome c553